MTSNKENLFQTMSRLIEAGIDPVSREAEIWARYGQTVAVLILDSSGFSRVSASHGVLHFLSKLMQMREISKPVFEAHRCKSVRFQADNVFAVFGDVDDAIVCALRVHQEIFDSELDLAGDEHFQVCIGIGYGRMLYSGTLEGYFAEEMNLASILGEDTAASGETLLTDSAYRSATKGLVDGFEAGVSKVSGLSLDFYRHQFTPKC